MEMVFDLGTGQERRIGIDHYSENVLLRRMTAYATYNRSTYPDLSGFQNTDFSTMTIVDEGESISYACDYNKITGLSMEYDKSGKTYHMNITVGYNTENG